jgi:hypothetical protein
MRKVFRTRRRKIIAAGISAGLVLSMAGSAYAAWLLEGAGQTTSTETTGTAGTAPVVVGAINMTDALTPGGPAGNIKVWVNDTGAAPVQVSSVVVAVTGTSAGAACAASNFVVTQPVFGVVGQGVVSLPYTLPAVSGDMSTDFGSNAMVAMVASAPVACENVTVNLSEVAS